MARKRSKAKYKASPAKRRKTSAEKKAPDEQTIRQRNQRYAVIQFAVAILIGCFVLITGDNVWRWCHNVMLGLFGSCAILWPILLLYISIVTAFEKQTDHPVTKIVLMVSIIILFCATFYSFSVSEPTALASFPKKLVVLYGSDTSHTDAGLFGGLLGIPLTAALGIIGTRIVLILALFVTVMILTGTTLVQLFKTITKPADVVVTNINEARERRQIERNRKESEIDIPLDDGVPQPPVNTSSKKGPEKPKKNAAVEQLKEVFSIGSKDGPQNHPNEQTEAAAVESTPVPSAAVQESTTAQPLQTVQTSKLGNGSTVPSAPEKQVPPTADPVQDGKYHAPPVSMLETTQGPGKSDVQSEIAAVGSKLVGTLQNFGVKTSFVGYSRGPAVTRYELQPAAGVKISKITNLSDDLSMNLATAGIRIEAPIPGKAAVGIEVPNKKNTVVRMRELVESNSFRSSKSFLTVALGRDIAGETAIADLSKMPHLLIAGATGSGKSVCINSMIISLLYKSTPDEVRFLMIDPKVVELGIYNGIPQLLVPVVTDPRKAAGALSWAVTEMLNRYKTFAANSVRDLKAYNCTCRFTRICEGRRPADGKDAPHRHHHRRTWPT